MFKLRMKVGLFEPAKEARHIEHCAKLLGHERKEYDCDQQGHKNEFPRAHRFFLLPGRNLLMWRRLFELVAQPDRPAAVREKDEQQAGCR